MLVEDSAADGLGGWSGWRMGAGWEGRREQQRIEDPLGSSRCCFSPDPAASATLVRASTCSPLWCQEVTDSEAVSAHCGSCLSEKEPCAK